MKFAKVTERLNGLGSEKWAVHIEGKRRAGLGEPMIFLSIGEPDAPPPVAILDEANRQMRAGRLRYAEGRGEANTRRALARLYTRQTGRTIGDDQFIFLPGTQTALYAAMMAVVEVGDEVLMADPYYATYEGVIAAAGGIPVPIKVDPDHGFHLKAADLEKFITPRTRVLLMNTPSNPTGAVFTRSEIEKIGKVCEKHDLWIISDEVYATMTYGNTVFSSPFDVPELEKRTIVVSSISKSHALPGFRCGWIAASPRILRPLRAGDGDHAVRLAAVPGRRHGLRARQPLPRSRRDEDELRNARPRTGEGAGSIRRRCPPACPKAACS